MAYRNGTYVAFHAEGTSDPTASDMKYYNTLKAWHANDGIEFRINDSHQKTYSVRDSSQKSTLRERLKERLRLSRNMLLIIGNTTRLDTDNVPFEIEYAVDECRIPIIAAYTDYCPILEPHKFRPLWPDALAKRIDNKTAAVIHIPFRKDPINAAISQFSHDNLPSGSLVKYVDDAYRKWGLLQSA